MNYIHKIQNGIDYIENHIDYPIVFNDVAKSAGMSQWHFQRIFKSITNETLKSYIRSRRLSNALHKLLNKKIRIIDISIEAGFESQESFTRAFSKQFNLTPYEYRKNADKNLILPKIQFDSDYLKHINQNISLEPEIYIQKPMQLVGMKTLFYSDDSDKNNIAQKIPHLWAKFLPRLKQIKHRIVNVCYGVILQVPKRSLLEYYAAVEVHQVEDIPEEMQVISLKETKYAKFTHLGKVKNLNNTVNYIYSNWLLNSGYQHRYTADIEVYTEKDYHPFSSQSKIYYSIPII